MRKAKPPAAASNGGGIPLSDIRNIKPGDLGTLQYQPPGHVQISETELTRLRAVERKALQADIERLNAEVERIEAERARLQDLLAVLDKSRQAGTDTVKKRAAGWKKLVRPIAEDGWSGVYGLAPRRFTAKKMVTFIREQVRGTSYLPRSDRTIADHIKGMKKRVQKRA